VSVPEAGFQALNGREAPLQGPKRQQPLQEGKIIREMTRIIRESRAKQAQHTHTRAREGLRHPSPAPTTSPSGHHQEAKQFDTTTKPLGIHSEEVSNKTEHKTVAGPDGQKARYRQKTLGIIERPLFEWFEKETADSKTTPDQTPAGNSAYNPSRAPLTKGMKEPQRRLAEYGLPVIIVSGRQDAFLKEQEACARPTTNNLAE
jgi:hypothetical protein